MGGDVDSIPLINASAQDIYKHLIDIVGYGFFEASAVEALEPYFWAALTEQGIYGYETASFKNILTLRRSINLIGLSQKESQNLTVMNLC